MKSLKILTVFLSAMIYEANYDFSYAIERTELVLVQGTGLGVGGGTQGGFDLVNICDIKKISTQSISIIIRLSMNEMDVTIDQKHGIKIDGSDNIIWKSAPTYFDAKSVSEYNNGAEKSSALYVNYRYYYVLEGRVSKIDDILTVESKSNMFIGTRPDELEPYSGVYSGKYLHKKLTDAISAKISAINCK